METLRYDELDKYYKNVFDKMIKKQLTEDYDRMGLGNPTERQVEDEIKRESELYLFAYINGFINFFKPTKLL